jgi:zinc protease
MPAVRAVTLDNGLQVIVQEAHTAPLVSVWCWYRVGSRDEPPGLTGASHWVEHMNFKGTEGIPQEEFKERIDRFGGFWNGYTWIDQTTYVETATKDALDQMLFMEAERMDRCLYEPEACESERTVIISELQGGENDPDQLLDIEVTATAFKAHPYRHPTIGWVGDLHAMTRDDLHGHYRRFYCPVNATLVVVGDVDTDEALRHVERRFGAVAPGEPPARVRTTEPEQTGERRLEIVREGTTAYFKVAYHAPAVTDPDFAPMLVLDAALTGAKGLNLWTSFRGPAPQRRARLYRALVDGGLAAAVNGAFVATADPYLFMVSATANDGTSLDRLEEATLSELDTVRAEGLSAPDVERAKRQLRARLVLENDSITNIGHQIGFFETVAGAGVLSAVPERIARVSAADVARVAAHRLATSNRTVGRFQPA